MIIKEDDSQHKTSIDQLISIPLPRTYLTDKNYNNAIVSELTPFFIIPKLDRDSFICWMNEEMGIRDITPYDWELDYVRPVLSTLMHERSQFFWKLENNEKTRMFFEEYNRSGGLLSEEYNDDWIIIGYNPDLDVFTSNSVFLTNVIGYFRGINPEDMVRESQEVYPIRTSLSYAMNLDGVLRMYSGFRGIKVMQNIMHTESLTVSRPDQRSVKLCKKDYLPFFRMIFNSDEIVLDTQYPWNNENTICMFAFERKDNSMITMTYTEGRLYYGPNEYIDLRTLTLYMTLWLNAIF